MTPPRSHKHGPACCRRRGRWHDEWYEVHTNFAPTVICSICCPSILGGQLSSAIRWGPFPQNHDRNCAAVFALLFLAQVLMIVAGQFAVQSQMPDGQLL